MLEKALKGSPRYWGWILFLIIVIGLCSLVYINQLIHGLTVTGMSRDVSWGFYIAQFTYLVGVAASGVMIALPFYLHNYEKYRGLVIMGEFLAISAVIMSLCFVIVDIGQPQRAMNMILHPTPNSMLFWDMVVLCGYLALNVIIGWTCLESERQRVDPPKWIKPIIYLSVVWGFAIHTVTAFLYAGLPSRHYWLSAIVAARFLAAAFCAGPAILLLILYVVRKVTGYYQGDEATKTLTKTITYAMCVNVFFFLLEIFTAFYSHIPGHMEAMTFLFSGLEGNTSLVGWMWAAAACCIVSIILLVPPKLRDNKKLLPFTLVILVFGTWVDKGMSFVTAGFTPNTFNEVTAYWPTSSEIAVSVMIWSIGALVLTILYKIATDIKRDLNELVPEDE